MSESTSKAPMTTMELWLWWLFGISAIVTLATASTLITALGGFSDSNPAVVMVVMAIAGGIASMTFIPVVILTGLRQLHPRPDATDAGSADAHAEH